MIGQKLGSYEVVETLMEQSKDSKLEGEIAKLLTEFDIN